MMTQSFVLNCPCRDAVSRVVEALVDSGLVVTQSFDLRVAASVLFRGADSAQQDQFRTLLAIPDDCTCPKHGTVDCDCQMVVMLVYGEVALPATLVAHGHDCLTWLSLVNTPEQRPDPSLGAVITQSLRLLCWTAPSSDANPGQEVCS